MARLDRMHDAWTGLTAALLGLMVCLFGAGSALAEEADMDRQTCAAEARILTAIVGDSKDATLSQHVTDTPYAGGPDGVKPVTTDTSPAWSGWLTTGPAPDLIRAWLSHADTTIADCWKGDPSDAPIRILSDAEYAYQMSGPFNRDKTIFTVSLPVFDAEKTHALVYVNTICPGLCGLRIFYLLGKQGEDWTIIGSRMLSVS